VWIVKVVDVSNVLGTSSSGPIVLSGSVGTIGLGLENHYDFSDIGFCLLLPDTM
jgi:hypothetical protein